MANRCVNAAQSVVFCPPVATFLNDENAKAENVAGGVALSVECDAAPQAARAKLESLLGAATAIVASGGHWTCAGCGFVGLPRPWKHRHRAGLRACPFF